jgi:hypothetical protein
MSEQRLTEKDLAGLEKRLDTASPVGTPILREAFLRRLAAEIRVAWQERDEARAECEKHIRNLELAAEQDRQLRLWASKARQQIEDLREALEETITAAEISMSGRGPQYPLAGTLKQCRAVHAATAPREPAP